MGLVSAVERVENLVDKMVVDSVVLLVDWKGASSVVEKVASTDASTAERSVERWAVDWVVD